MQPGIGFWLTQRERLSGEREALVQGERRLTYRELNRRVNRLAAWLSQAGLKTGDRCAYLAYNGVEVVELIFAAAKLGLILVPLNWRLAAKELAFILSDSGTETLFFDFDFTKTVQALSEEKGVGLKRRMAIGGKAAEAESYEETLFQYPDQEPESAESIGMDTPHIIMYTAGTTGRPKGAVLTQACSFWNAVNLELDMGFRPRGSRSARPAHVSHRGDRPLHPAHDPRGRDRGHPAHLRCRGDPAAFAGGEDHPLFRRPGHLSFPDPASRISAPRPSRTVRLGHERGGAPAGQPGPPVITRPGSSSNRDSA